MAVKQGKPFEATILSPATASATARRFGEWHYRLGDSWYNRCWRMSPRPTVAAITPAM